MPVDAPDLSTSRTSTWRPGRPVDLHATLGVLVRGSGDPTHRRERDGLWRTCRTPDGPATVHLRAGGGEVRTTAWGPGAEWALAGVPSLLGADDDARDFVPAHPEVAWALRLRPGWRVPRTQRVMEAMAPAIIEQLVTGQEAFGGWRRLLNRFGEKAPGPAGDAGMKVVPTPAQWAAIASWDWLQAGVDGRRSAIVVSAARSAGRLEQTLDLPFDAAEARMRAIPGVGVWTAAEVRQRAHGDADAVSFGDYHLPGHIGWVLTGSEMDDDGLAELLQPYRPHRYRVQRLLELEGPRRPRHGPRMGPRAGTCPRDSTVPQGRAQLRTTTDGVASNSP